MPTAEETAAALQDEANALWDELGGGMRDFDGLQVTPALVVDGVQLYRVEAWGGATTTPGTADQVRELCRRYLHSRLGRTARPRRKPPEPEESKPMNAPAATEPALINAPLENLYQGKNYRQRRGPGWDAEIEELAQSIREKDVVEPIIVRQLPGGSLEALEVVCGERRVLASRRAGKTSILALLRVIADEDIIELQLTENKHANPHPLDEADAFQALIELGRTPADIAGRLGRDVGYVHHRLKLRGLSKKCREALDNEHITLGVALLLARLPNQKLQDQGLDEVSAEGGGRFDGGGLMSVANARKALEANVMLALKSAPFKRDDATLVPKAGPCTTCPKRTGMQAELFADASSPDLCTDPGCYREKVDALYQVRSTKHKADGGDVLNQKDTKALLGHTWDQKSAKLRNQYTRLDERVYAGGKPKTVKQLFKGELPPITLAKDPDTGLVVELVDRKLADKAKGAEDRSGRSKPDASEAAANRRERLKDQARKEATRRCIAAIVQKVEALVAWEGVGEKLLRPLAFATLEATWHDGRSELAKRRGWLDGDERPKSKSRVAPVGEKLEAAVEKAPARELAGVIVELILSRGAPTRWSDKPGDEWDAVAEALGVDYQAFHANVVEEQRAVEKAKGKPATKPVAKKPKTEKLETKARRLKKAVEKKLANGNGSAPAPRPARCSRCRMP